MVLFSSLITASPLVCGADPVVTPSPLFTPGPEDCAVPALLVPGEGGEASLAELPAPLGSWPALFSPPTLAGPDGTPLTLEVPAPAEPALGVPTALPVPADDPPAAPPALPLPPLCASEITGEVRIAIVVIATAMDVLLIANLRFMRNRGMCGWFLKERFPSAMR